MNDNDMESLESFVD